MWDLFSDIDDFLLSFSSHNSLDHRYITNIQSHEPRAAGDDGDKRDGMELVRMEEIEV